MATFDTVSTILTEADGVEQIVGASISPNLLSLLGVRPVLGRSFSTEEAEQGQRLVLISYRFWQARFIRTSSDYPLAMAGALREAVRRVDKNAPVYGAAPLEQQLGTYIAQRRFRCSWPL